MPRAVDVFVGNRIRDRRIELGLSQAELAAVIRIAAETMNDHEDGIARPDPETLANLAVVLHCPLSWLFGIPGKQCNQARQKSVAGPTRGKPTRGGEMNYRFYLLNGDAHFGAAESFYAPDDAAANEIAAATFDGCSDVFQGYELWRSAELVARAQKRPPSRSEIRLSELMLKHQEVVLDLEDRLHATFTCLKASRRLLETTAALRERTPQPVIQGR